MKQLRTYTTEQIYTMPAGDELDALIAEALYGYPARIYSDALGPSVYVVDMTAERTEHGSTRGSFMLGGNWEKGYDAEGNLVEFYGCLCPSYSARIERAWELVQVMAEKGCSCDIEFKGADREYAFTAEVSFRKGIETIAHAVADTVPLAICRAFLSIAKSGVCP